MIVSEKNMTTSYFFTTLRDIFNFPGFDKYVFKIYNKYKEYLFDIIDLFPKKKDGQKTFAYLLISVQNFLKKYQDPLFELVFRLISHYKEYDDIANDLKDFFFDNRTNTSFLKDLGSILNNKTVVEDICEVLKFDDEITNTILKIVLKDKKLIKLAIDFLHNQTVVIEVTNILAHIFEPKYIYVHVPDFLRNITNDNPTAKIILLNAFQNIVRNVLTEKSLKEMLNTAIIGSFKKYIYNGFKDYNISDDCSELFNYTYFRPLKNVKDDFRFYYSKKLIFDSTKSKNDFLTYENCLYGNKKFNNTLYQIKPIFVFGKIIDKQSQQKLKNSSYYEKYNYMLSFCFPQGINSSTHESLCNDDDYGNLLLIFNSISNNVISAGIKIVKITEEDLKRRDKHLLYFSLIVIIGALPLFISIVLKLYEIIKLSNPQTNEINNKLKLKNKNKTYKKIKTNEIQKREFLYRKKAPKWFRFLIN